MQKLKDIFKGVAILNEVSFQDTSMGQLTFDSRDTNKDSIFFAIRGTQVDGHSFLDQVAQAGCTLAVVEVLHPEINIQQIVVANSSETLAVAADNFYRNPSQDMTLVGVTGTNGKTTTTTLLFNLFTKLGYKCGLISTVVNKIGHEDIPSTHTTPNSIALAQLMAKMKDAGCSHVFMEVSSHALHQKRVAALKFDVAVFTNITHDHLDYHKTFQEYISVKKQLFDFLPKGAHAITNVDDKNGNVMLQNTKANKYSLSLKAPSDFKGKIIENEITGLVMQINQTEVWAQLIGEFNAYNLLSVFAVSQVLGADKLEVLTKMSELKSVEGRFEFFKSQNQTTCIVDYAHTPDALQNVLKTINAFKRHNQVISIAGCGGDRDKTKRPKMAKIAAQMSDKVILTSDNPRTEDPSTILEDMEAGLNEEQRIKCLTISDRKEAIKTAISLSNAGDIILIAGKGHEKYQDISGTKYPFDDYEIAKELFTKMKK